MIRHAFALLLLAITPAAAETAPPRPVSLTAQAGDFRLTWSDGRVMRGAALVGARLTLADRAVIIAAARPSPRDPQGEIWQFDLRLADGSRYCTPDPAGEQWAMTLPDEAAPGSFSLTCTSGGLGKCMDYGYVPWRQGTDGRSLTAYHRACLHMLRAAYSGGARAWTRNGTQVDIFDHAGVQPDDAPSDMPFEAGWDENGAVCLAHPRIPEHGSLEDILAETPRLTGRLGPEACTEGRARALGALIFNRSR